MIFEGENNQFLELKIVDYQFNEFIDNLFDANWLCIDFEVKSALKSFKIRDAALLVSEVHQIIDWFKKLLDHKILVETTLSFIEPSLSFTLLKNTKEEKHFKIEVEVPRSDNAPNKKLSVNCIYNTEELFKIVSALKEEVKLFPLRTVKNTTT